MRIIYYDSAPDGNEERTLINELTALLFPQFSGFPVAIRHFTASLNEDDFSK